MVVWRIGLGNGQAERAFNLFDCLARYRLLEFLAALLQYTVRIDPAVAAWLLG